MNIIAIIPARSGSKGIPNKNIKIYKKYPLIFHSINIAKKCKYINEVIVSTDSEEYKLIAEKYGAIVPYIRPKSISDDLSTDYEFVKYHLDWCNLHNIKNPDLIVQLRPTYPNRNIIHLNNSIKIMINKYKEYDSLRSVIKFEKSPFKMYLINENKLEPLFNNINNIEEPYNKCRQVLPDTYLHNGYIDIIKTYTVINKESVTGDKIYPYIMNSEEINDIDTVEDWKKSLIN
jgi:CMP-N,N'-diacetyllegionaminic acid synthase